MAESDHAKMVERLQTELRRARLEHDATKLTFDRMVAEVPSGIPHPDGSLRIQKAGKAYRAALQNFALAARRLSEFTQPTKQFNDLNDRCLPTTEDTAIVQERRERFRYHMDTDLRYEISRRGQGKPMRGTGRVLDLSSKALAFSTSGPAIERGMPLKVSIPWPAALDDTCKLRLTLEGTVLRTRGNVTVVSIDRTEFRTAGKTAVTASQEIDGILGDIESQESG